MNKATILTGFFCLLILGFFAIAAETTDEPLLGDESDGSRATPNHLMPLFPENEDGEKGTQIKPDDKFPLPFSTRITCGECHNYEEIKQGWHFNVIDSNESPGRPGQPWIYFDSKLCTQIPISYRPWPGTYKPEQIGLSEFQFTRIFGRHMPGGGPGEVEATGDDDIGAQMVSGKLEINCLVCHNAHYGQNMGGVTGYSVQVSSNRNFRWAATASSDIAEVTGSAAKMDIFYDPFFPDPDIEDAPTVKYRKEAFNENNEVLLQIVREVPNDRCYYCHSNLDQKSGEKTEKWTQDEDVHLSAGLKCVDCHRNGLNHNITRGYTEEGIISDNPLVTTSTCESCHLPDEKGEPKAGRLGAPIPKHPGIPSIHFDNLTCTACHSGPWPQDQTGLVKTSRAHRLGTPNVNKEPDTLPHIVSPILAKQQGIIAEYAEEGTVVLVGEKLAPHKALWPNFWGVFDGNNVTPIAISTVDKALGDMFDKLELPYHEGWPELTEEVIADALMALNKSVDGKASYISAGKLFNLDDSGQLQQQEHPAAQPYLWPIAHNVRPAAQALGVRYCTDCHATDAPFFFGDVKVDTPLVKTQEVISDVDVVVDQNAVSDPNIVPGQDVTANQDEIVYQGIYKKMYEFQDVNPTYTWLFAFSFVFRPWMKLVVFCCCLILAGILLLYALKALGCLSKVLGGEK